MTTPETRDPAPAPAPTPPPQHPSATEELHKAARLAANACELVLAHPGRIAATLPVRDRVAALLRVLAIATAVASLPFGFVHDPTGFWKVAVLFAGPVLLCWPALQVFGSFCGRTLHPAQTLALTLVVSSTAALFSLGFTPILWFLGATMTAGDRIDHSILALLMLVAAMAAGLLQLLRCVAHDKSHDPGRALPLLVAWQIVVVLVAMRMGRALHLWP